MNGTSSTYVVPTVSNRVIHGRVGSENITEDVHEWISGLYTLSDRMDTYIPPILIAFGVCGNAFSVMILRSEHFRKCPCSMLLSLLAIVDTGVLCTGLLRIWIMTVFDVDVRTLSTASCRIHYFVTLVFQHASSWTVIMITAERYVSVSRPMTAKILCSRQKLASWFLVMLLCLCMFDGHVLFTLHIQNYEYYDQDTGNYSVELDCQFDRDSYYYGCNIWPWVDFALLAAIPLMLLVIGNSLIVSRVMSIQLKGPLATASPNVVGRRRRITSMTSMLFAITITFFATVTPIEIYLTGYQYWDIETPVGTAYTLVAHVICSLWYYTNNAFNFLLYCVSGSRFRRALGGCWDSIVKKLHCANTAGNERYAIPLWSRDRFSSIRSWYD